MEVFDGTYYKSTKWFLRTIGLWPYEKIYQRRFRCILFFAFNLSIALPQVALLIKNKGKDLAITFENSASIMFCLACLSKYLVTYINENRLKLLFLQIARNWQEVTDIKEREILTRFYQEAKTLVSFYTIYAFFAWSFYTSIPFVPYVLDMIHPIKNGTRALLMPFYADYIFFDQHDYHYWCSAHLAIVYSTTAILYAGVDGIYVLTVKHTCGLFAITCNRLEQISAFNEDKTLKNDIIVRHNLSEAIILHNESIGCLDLLENSFSKCLLLVQSMCLLTLPITAVYALYIFKSKILLLRLISFMCGIILHLLYLNWVGQQIIESSSRVFDSTYNSDWYTIKINSRKFIIIIMNRSLRACELTAGSITTLSMETFVMLMKTSMSYFTVFLSVT